MGFSPVSEIEDGIGRCIVDCAFKVHHGLGPGLLENIYEACFCYELKKHGLSFRKQVTLPIEYDGIIFDEGLRLDVLVEDLVICELKAVENFNSVYTAQLMTYLKLARKRLGFLINFNVPIIKNGIKRIIL